MTTRKNWTDSTPTARAIALDLARGVYQQNVVLGRENLSGSTLRGKARGYGARYAASRANLRDRLRTAGLSVSERREAHGARVLVLRAPFDAFDPMI